MLSVYDFETQKKKIEEKVSHFNSYLYGIIAYKDVNYTVHQRIRNVDILALNYAQRFYECGVNTLQREKAIKVFFRFVEDLYGDEAKEMIRNSVISWNKNGHLHITFYDRLDFKNSRKTVYFELDESIDALDMSGDISEEPITCLMKYGISESVIKILNDGGFEIIEEIRTDIIDNNARRMLHVSGIANGQLRRIKKALSLYLNEKE